MVSFGDIPTDGNFSGWKSYLGDKADSCDSTFQDYSLTWGQQLFSTFDNPRKAAALETALDGGSIGSDYLFPQRGAEFAFVIIAIILFIAGIFAACALTKGLRGLVSRCLCGRCRDRDRVRMKDAPPHDRSFLCISHIVAFATIVVLGIMSFLGTAQAFSGLRAVSCNMWQQLYGHYFGASGLKAGSYNEIALGWQGTHQMLEEIEGIRMKATPDENGESMVYKRLNDGYIQLKSDATAQGDATIALMQEFMDNATLFDQGVYALDPFAISLTVNASVLKGGIFQNELNETLLTGWVQIERLLEQYAGANAPLTLHAVESTEASTTTIQQVDLVMAQMAKLWKKASGLVNALVYLVGSLEIIGVIVGIVMSAILMWMTFNLLHALRHDVLVDKTQRTCWAVSYATFCVLAGLFALLCSVHVMTAAVGSDACLMAEDALFTRGNWNILGEQILEPADDMQVDVRAVLDTCVRADGNGDVASALGLDGRIRALAEDVVEAQEDVSSTREALLNRKEKGTRAQVLQLGFHDVAQMVTIGKTSVGDESGGFVGATSAWNETLFVRADVDYGYADHGPRSVLCLVSRMAMSTAWTLYTCLAEGLQYDVSPLNALADTVNNALTEIGISDGSVPTAFCSKMLSDAGHPCAAQVTSGSDGWVSSSGPADTTIATWAAIIDASNIVQNSQIRDYYYDAGAKFTYAINKWKALETMAETDMDSLSGLQNLTQAQRLSFCSDTTKSCNYREWRENADAIFQERSKEIYPAVVDLFGLVDTYVDDLVIPTMESLIVEANAITDHGNCQFEGTALHFGVLPAACEAIFPANAVASIITGLLSVVFSLLAVHVWKWHHYLADLASAHGGSVSQYELTKELSPMSENKNFLLYSGAPTAVPDVESAIPSVEGRQKEFFRVEDTGAAMHATLEVAQTSRPLASDTSFQTHQG